MLGDAYLLPTVGFGISRSHAPGVVLAMAIQGGPTGSEKFWIGETPFLLVFKAPSTQVGLCVSCNQSASNLPHPVTEAVAAAPDTD